jgi:hypothetical protein
MYMVNWHCGCQSEEVCKLMRQAKIIPQLGAILAETPAPPPETAEEKAKWEKRFSGNTPKSRLIEWGLLEDRVSRP